MHGNLRQAHFSKVFDNAVDAHLGKFTAVQLVHCGCFFLCSRCTLCFQLIRPLCILRWNQPLRDYELKIEHVSCLHRCLHRCPGHRPPISECLWATGSFFMLWSIIKDCDSLSAAARAVHKHVSPVHTWAQKHLCMTGLCVTEQICLFPRQQQIIEPLQQDKQITHRSTENCTRQKRNTLQGTTSIPILFSNLTGHTSLLMKNQIINIIGWTFSQIITFMTQYWFLSVCKSSFIYPEFIPL